MDPAFISGAEQHDQPHKKGCHVRRHNALGLRLDYRAQQGQILAHTAALHASRRKNGNHHDHSGSLSHIIRYANPILDVGTRSLNIESLQHCPLKLYKYGYVKDSPMSQMNQLYTYLIKHSIITDQEEFKSFSYIYPFHHLSHQL